MLARGIVDLYKHMIDVTCTTCLGDARENVDEGQKMKILNFIKKLVNLIRK